MLDKLRNKAHSLYNFTRNDKYLTIINILECDECFFKMDMDIAINILMDLNFTKAEAKKIYVNLISRENAYE